MTKPGKQRHFWQDYLLHLAMVFVWPVFLYVLYLVLSLPSFLQILVGLLIWTAMGYAIYRAHQKMKKGLEKE